MKDDLVERCARAIAESDANVFGDLSPRNIAAYLDNARAVLAIARPAILEEAAAEIASAPANMPRHILSRRVRSLAHTTGQEG